MLSSRGATAVYRQSNASQIITVFVFKISAESPSAGELKRTLETSWSGHFSIRSCKNIFTSIHRYQLADSISPCMNALTTL